jgi:hypothetical protein
VLLEPIDVHFDVKEWFGKLDEYLDEPFMHEGRQQPPMPPARAIFDDDLPRRTGANSRACRG